VSTVAVGVREHTITRAALTNLTEWPEWGFKRLLFRAEIAYIESLLGGAGEERQERE